MACLMLSLLGPFQARFDEQVASGLQADSVRSLLAYLAIETDRDHARRNLAGLLWPELPDHAALSNLRYALSDLRRAVGDTPSLPSKPILVARHDPPRPRRQLPGSTCASSNNSVMRPAWGRRGRMWLWRKALPLSRPFSGGFRCGTAPPSVAFWAREQYQRKRSARCAGWSPCGDRRSI